MAPRFSQILLAGCLLIFAPLAGVIIGGDRLAPYLEFPPLTRRVVQPEFNPVIFGIIALVDLTLVILLIWGLGHCRYQHPSPKKHAHPHRFPVWGWLAVAWLFFWWAAAWSRWPWLAPIQKHTFTPLWAGYIMVVNALAHQQSGACLLVRRPAAMAGLAVLSALFWWFFEYLNRFVQNWYYLGVESFDPSQYILFASLSFATVLPAVVSTLYWLATLPAFNQPAGASPRAAILSGGLPRLPASLGLATATLIVCLLPRWPHLLFPFVWVAPVVVLVCIQALWEQPRAVSPFLINNLRPLVLAPLATLICGFFWELWNFHSLAKWQYAIPFVDRWYLFEMPVLGYGGYLPFGWACWAVAAWLYPDLCDQAPPGKTATGTTGLIDIRH